VQVEQIAYKTASSIYTKYATPMIPAIDKYFRLVSLENIYPKNHNIPKNPRGIPKNSEYWLLLTMSHPPPGKQNPSSGA